MAVTVWSPLTFTTQAPAPPQPPPLQPPNVDPITGVALSVTLVPLVKLNVQTVPQLMPLGALVTVPEPSPFLMTVSVLTLGVVVNCATTV